MNGIGQWYRKKRKMRWDEMLQWKRSFNYVECFCEVESNQDSPDFDLASWRPLVFSVRVIWLNLCNYIMLEIILLHEWKEKRWLAVNLASLKVLCKEKIEMWGRRERDVKFKDNFKKLLFNYLLIWDIYLFF